MVNGVKEHLGGKTAPRKITINMMRVYAKENDIDLQGKSRKQDIWDIIRTERKREPTLEEIDLPDIETVNTNVLNLREKDLIVFDSQNCSSWLPAIMETGVIGRGIEGDIYAYDDKVMKVEYTGEGVNYIYSIIFMRRLNQYIENNNIPNFTKTFMVYVCKDRLVTFMEKIDGPELKEVKPMKRGKGRLTTEETISIFLQILMVFVLFFSRGMNHFDLHDGNILLEKTTYKVLEYSFAGESIRIPTFGRVAKVIDFGDIGFMSNTGEIKLSESKSVSGVADGRKYPHSFYKTGFNLMCGDFPDLENKEKLCDEWKTHNDELFKIAMQKIENISKDYRNYKVATAQYLFSLAQQFYRFNTSGKTLKIVLV